ncbi:hypothetical protein K461DRAFT_275824 [Myriangium duriaei CBS 260.36]|uniref:Uncharacterized protein n=1 Tax=Myriangium duriaei CBS 260.36 TaxID=1168546 RepID=A0A9P4J9B0_9PEZI|nr:hypothetical protein K461DRAFT_275824 [Myriangium duriaei CBS 260.36]
MYTPFSGPISYHFTDLLHRSGHVEVTNGGQIVRERFEFISVTAVWLTGLAIEMVAIVLKLNATPGLARRSNCRLVMIDFFWSSGESEALTGSSTL